MGRQMHAAAPGKVELHDTTDPAANTLRSQKPNIMPTHQPRLRALAFQQSGTAREHALLNSGAK